MTPEHVEAARKIARARLDEMTNRTAFEVVESLENARMLRTGIEKRAVEACEEYATKWPKPHSIGGASELATLNAVQRVGAASLALKQPPKPAPWIIERDREYESEHPNESGYFVRRGPFGTPRLWAETKRHAEAMRAALNVCDTEAPNA